MRKYFYKISVCFSHSIKAQKETGKCHSLFLKKSVVSEDSVPFSRFKHIIVLKFQFHWKASNFDADFFCYYHSSYAKIMRVIRVNFKVLYEYWIDIRHTTDTKERMRVQCDKRSLILKRQTIRSSVKFATTYTALQPTKPLSTTACRH